MTSVSKPGHRFEVLDALRGICACMIVLLHFKTQSGLIANSAFVSHGPSFVDFFFVLSGFVITSSYGDRLESGYSIWDFMRLRMGRIYPLHFVMLMAFLAFELLFWSGALGTADRQPFEGSSGVPTLIYSLLLVQTFFGPDSTSWNGPSWSIAVEMWTYLIFALMFRFLKNRVVPVALLLWAGGTIWLFFLTDRYLHVFHDGAIVRCILGFSLGVVAFRTYQALSARDFKLSFGVGTALELLAVAAVVTLITLTGPTPGSLAIPPLFFLAVLLFAHQSGAVSRLLLLPSFQLVGLLSYSIYMIHGFLQYRAVNVATVIEKLSHGRYSLVVHDDGHNYIGGSQMFGDAMSVAFLALVIACAYVTYRLIEKPAQDWSRRWVQGGKPKRDAVAAEQAAPTF